MTKDNGNNRKQFGQMKNTANIGDIVTVAGYHGRTFFVESYTHELAYLPGVVDESILYDVTDTRNNEYLLAFQEDIHVIKRADDGGYSLPVYVGDILAQEWNWVGNMAYERDEVKAVVDDRPREKTHEERIDELLTEYNDVRGLIELFGEHKDEDRRDRKYILRKAQIEADLRRLTIAMRKEG